VFASRPRKPPHHMRTAIVIGALLAQATFTSQTVVVVVPVSVSGPGGRAIAGLAKEQFHLYDDGRLQTIATFAHGDAPLTLGLVVDCSASMRAKLSTVTDAIERFARSARPADQLFLVDFNERVRRPRFSGRAFTSDARELGAAVAALRAAGATALHDALIEAAAHLHHGTADRKALVVMSDGTDTASRQTFAEARAAMREVGAVVYTIGLSAEHDDRRSYRDLRALSGESGGAAYFLRTVDEISIVLDDIAGDLRDQYLLGFVPARAGTKPGQIRVTVDAPDHRRVTIRSRTSYVLPRSDR
jgi:Ca-activated chloride channel homolog